jgi:di/tricarboxylate transporter
VSLPQWLFIFIVLFPLTLVMLGRLRMDLAALLMAVLLGILQFAGLGMLGPAGAPQDAVKAISGFSQPVVITLISLFILTRSLEKSGFTGWVTRRMMALSGDRPGWLIAAFTAITALLSLFMNNLAAGALVLPSALETSRKTGIATSKLLIPVAYGSLLGGSATYFTTANIIMSDLLQSAHPAQHGLTFLDFFPTGGLIALVGILFLGIAGNRLLPSRKPASQAEAFSKQRNGANENPAVHPFSAIASIVLTFAAIGASIAGVPVYLSALAGAVAVLLLQLISVEEAYHSVEWQAIFLIAGMYAVSLAMVQTGVADRLGRILVAAVLPLGALGVAAGGYLLSLALTQFMGGQVSALVAGPVMISAALANGVNPQAVAAATAIGCSASFLTPMAHPVNILMIGPGNYQFKDFFKVGWLLTLLSFLALLAGLLVFWRL